MKYDRIRPRASNGREDYCFPIMAMLQGMSFEEIRATKIKPSYKYIFFSKAEYAFVQYLNKLEFLKEGYEEHELVYQLCENYISEYLVTNYGHVTKTDNVSLLSNLFEKKLDIQDKESPLIDISSPQPIKEKNTSPKEKKDAVNNFNVDASKFKVTGLFDITKPSNAITLDKSTFQDLTTIQDFSVIVKGMDNTNILANDLSCFKIALGNDNTHGAGTSDVIFDQSVSTVTHSHTFMKQQPIRKPLGVLYSQPDPPQLPLPLGPATNQPPMIVATKELIHTNREPKRKALGVLYTRPDFSEEDVRDQMNNLFKNSQQATQTQIIDDSLFMPTKTDISDMTFAPNCNSTILPDKFQRLSLVHRQNGGSNYCNNQLLTNNNYNKNSTNTQLLLDQIQEEKSNGTLSFM